MENKKNLILITTLSIIPCIIMYLVEKNLQVNFLIKSIIKLLTFLTSIKLFMQFGHKKLDVFNLKDVNKKILRNITFFSLIVYILILIAYFLLRKYIDLQNIRVSLLKRENINKENFIYVSLYISFINSFIEEIYFRRYIFVETKILGYRKYAYFLSSVLFSIYHISIISTWFSKEIFVIIVIGLLGVGILFNYLTEKSKSFLGAWIVHILANLSINTVGFIMLGII